MSARIDRGEGHPVNRAQPGQVPDAYPPPPRPAGLKELAEAVAVHREALPDPPRRLMLRAEHRVVWALGAQSPEPHGYPSRRIPDGVQGLSYRQVEVATADLPVGYWQLVDGGDVVADGYVQVAE